MTMNEKHFTFIWNIKNISFNMKIENLCSPSFCVEEMEGTQWHLILKNTKDDMSCRIKRENDSGPENFQLDYELSFLTGDGYVLRSGSYSGKGYRKGYIDSGTSLCVEKDEILKHNKHLYIPSDILTIRCRMWISKGTIAQSGRCFAETIIETEYRSFIGIIGKFSSTESSRKSLVSIQPSSVKNFFSSVNLCVADDGKLELEIKPLDHDHLYKYKCKIFIRDVYGNKLKSGHGEFLDTKTQCISLTLPKEHLMENMRYYLPNDTLTIECEVIFPTGEIIEKADEPEYGFKREDTQEIVSNVVKTYFSSNEYQSQNLINLEDDCQENETISPSDNPKSNIDELEPENGFVTNETQSIIVDPSSEVLFCNEQDTTLEDDWQNCSTLKDDWLALFNEGISCDTALNTKTETFLVHKAVLIARSPVFKSMFTTDMTEKASNSVDIDDVNADTLRRMLKFMYSDTLDDLDYESANNLYLAADKYSILSLRNRCASFLIQNFLHSRTCEILLLADATEDKELKNAVKEYIAGNGEDVISREEWDNLDENQPLLVIEVLRAKLRKL